MSPWGEHDAADVRDRTAHAGQLSLQIVPVAGQSGVDDGDAVLVVDQVGRDDVVADAVQVRAESHRGHLVVIMLMMAKIHSHDGYGQ